jgi:hypothetical protein
MAKPIPATPVVRGEDAKRIVKEIREGTAQTPERLQKLRQADEVFRNASIPNGVGAKEP